MTQIQNSMDAFTKQIRDERIKGHSLEEIASGIGVPVEEVVEAWSTYISGYTIESKEEQWILHLARLENLLVKVNRALEDYDSIEDFEVILKLLDRIEALQSLNLSRKEEAERKADEMYRLQAEQLIGIVTATHKSMIESLDKAFAKHKVGAKAKESILTDMGEKFLPKALEAIEAEVED
jgi:hypothetical protein